jgi:Putative transposase/Transposase zinc-binding domain/TAZ zinc finger
VITSAKAPDIAEILSEHINEYTFQFGALTEKQKKVVKHITECRTPAMGGHEFICDTCADYLLHYNSCRDRHCPVCQGTARAAWVQNRTDELLPIGHFHVVFTVPQELNPLALRNKSAFYDILFRASSETLTQLGKDPRWLGAQIGFISILHTWGQNLMDHPHIHCIVPGGGIRLDGKKWVSFRNNYLIPVAVLSEVFRGKFMDYFKQAVTQKKITFSGECQKFENEIVYKSFVRKLYEKNWVVFSKEPFGESLHLVKYLGRYTHRIAISNDRIVKHDDDTVQFNWKDYADDNKIKVMEVSAVEFIRRFFLHTLPDHFTRIRYYGFMSNSNKNKKLPDCFRLLEKKFEKKKRQLKRVAEILLEVAGIDITKCTHCSQGHYLNVGDYQRFHHLYFE